METNPYAAPGAVVDDARAGGETNLEALKASRWQRLGAAFIDGLIVGLCAFPLTMWWALRQGTLSHFSHRDLFADLPFVQPTFVIVSIVLLLGVIACNLALLNHNSQTIGKRALGIKIVRTDGSPVALSRVVFLRWLPTGIAGRIPFIGRFVALADVLVIFGSERRCIHDYIADTIVIVD